MTAVPFARLGTADVYMRVLVLSPSRTFLTRLLTTLLTFLTSTQAVAKSLRIRRPMEGARHSALWNAQKAHWLVARNANGIRMVDFENLYELGGIYAWRLSSGGSRQPHNTGIHAYK